MPKGLRVGCRSIPTLTLVYFLLTKNGNNYVGKEEAKMKRVDNYLIGRKCGMIEPLYNEEGRLCSIVFEGKRAFIVNQSPKKLIENSLLDYGTNYIGATKSAKSLLGNICMPPIMLCSTLDLYWFPSVSPDRDDCYWFSLTHIDDLERMNEKRTKVIMKSGHSITIDVNYYRFRSKWHLAMQLKYEIDKTNRRPITLLYYPNRRYTYKKQRRVKNYIIRKRGGKK